MLDTDFLRDRLEKLQFYGRSLEVREIFSAGTGVQIRWGSFPVRAVGNTGSAFLMADDGRRSDIDVVLIAARLRSLQRLQGGAGVNSGEYWQMLFEGWPESFPTKGIVVTSFQEVIPFVDFMISEGMVVLERDKPDTHDARKVVLDFGAIAALKITATFELDRFEELGFRHPQQ